jgi:chromosomal replication initiation ATPase DnaA
MGLVIKNIIDICCDAYGVTPEQLHSNSRKAVIVFARQMTAKILRDELNMSYTDIGKAIGSKDHPKHHTTAIYCVQSVNDLIDVNDSITVKAYNYICDEIEKLRPSKPYVIVYFSTLEELEEFVEDLKIKDTSFTLSKKIETLTK